MPNLIDQCTYVCPTPKNVTLNANPDVSGKGVRFQV